MEARSAQQLALKAPGRTRNCSQPESGLTLSSGECSSGDTDLELSDCSCATASTTTPMQVSDCFEYGSNYRNHDVGSHKNVASPAACQALCVLDQACNFFSYKTTNQRCYMNSDFDLVLNSIFVAGPKVCP